MRNLDLVRVFRRDSAKKAWPSRGLSGWCSVPKGLWDEEKQQNTSKSYNNGDDTIMAVSRYPDLGCKDVNALLESPTPSVSSYDSGTDERNNVLSS